MRAIILSAGQGTRLLPHTADSPKCLLAVRGELSLLELQLRALRACGIRDVCVVVGFGAEKVEKALRARRADGMRVRSLYNPFYKAADNLMTCWLARPEMRGDFLLLNGDTLFEPAVLQTLMAAPPAPLTLAIDRKRAYDDDDMKVSLGEGGRLRAVGKKLDASEVQGESIGLMRFRADGGARFRAALDEAVRHHESVKAWYLQVIGCMAQSTRVATASIEGRWWAEVDSAEDLEGVRNALAGSLGDALEHPPCIREPIRGPRISRIFAPSLAALVHTRPAIGL